MDIVQIDRFINTIFGNYLQMLAHPVSMVGIRSERRFFSCDVRFTNTDQGLVKLEPK